MKVITMRKAVVFLIAGMAFSAIPLAAFADPAVFSITNNTSYDTTFIINHGDCSVDLMGVAGLIKANTWNSISPDVLNNLCGNAKNNCVIDIYMTKQNKCDGSPVATIVLDTQKGISSVDNKKVNGFFVVKSLSMGISITGGPIQPAGNTSTSTPSGTATTSTPAASTTPATTQTPAATTSTPAASSATAPASSAPSNTGGY